jgi:DNA-binding transcriptional MerR regulator
MVCVKRNELEVLIEEVKKIEDYYDEVCVGYDVEEPKLILEAYDTSPCIGCDKKTKTIEIKYNDYEKMLKVLSEVIRIYNIEEIKNKINSYESRIEKIKEWIEYEKNHNKQPDPKDQEKIRRLELKIKELEKQIQNLEPELLLGKIAEDCEDFKKFLDIINAPPSVKQLFEYYASGKFIGDEVKIPLNICDGFEQIDEEIDVSDPYWCVKDGFYIEGYLVFLPAKKSLKVLLSITSNDFKELERDVTLYIMKFDDAYTLIKTINNWYKNDLIS